MRRGAAIYVAMAALGTLAAPQARSADLPGAAAAAAEKKGATDCTVYGAKFFALGDTGFCAKFGLDLMGFVAKDFAKQDIAMVGQRLPSASYGAGPPILYYYKKDFGEQTRNPYPGLDAQASFMAARQTDLGPLVAFVNLQLAGQVQNYGDETRYIANNSVDGSIFKGMFDQAWVRLGGLEAGIQPSMFGFARWGYTVTPGYSSLVDTPAVSYTYRIDDIPAKGEAATVSVAIEDPDRRDMADGALSEYGSVRWPDFVAQARFGGPSFLFHIAGAAHEIRDRAAADCCGASVGEAWGGAGTLASELHVKWSDVFGDAAAGMYGRLMIQGAVARGAIGYLGVPFFATDYVADADGAIHMSQGYSAIVSYEHLWTPTLKSSLTYSLFETSQTSGAALLSPGLPPLIPAVPMWFDVKVHGSELQAGIEDMVQPDLMIGFEASYTWTSAHGAYAGAAAAPLDVSFPAVAAYVRRVF